MSETWKRSQISDPAGVILASLDDLLDRERSALLEGDLEAVSRSLREKERLIDALNGIRPAEGDLLGAIREKVQRNQVLLDGALDGIRAVADRMSALRRIRETLETYDQSGRRTVIEGLRKGRIEKRA